MSFPGSGVPALGPLVWPRTRDEEPHAHIATVVRGEAKVLVYSPDFTEQTWPEASDRLPDSGYLEVFHHLGTYGNPEDDVSGGRLVRHVLFPGEDLPPLVDPPRDLEVPHVVCVPVLLATGFSAPCAIDFVQSADAIFEAAERVEAESNTLWTAWRRGTDKVNEPVFPISHLYGHSDSGSQYALDILHEVRPLADDNDSYALLLSVESRTHFAGWFGDAENFEAWIRSSDLASRRFGQAWWMIRTDH